MPFACRLISGSLLALALLQSVPAAAQYPDKPITVIVPFAAGGPTDVVARLVGDHMSRTLGQTLVVENIGGAGGTLGMTRAAQAQPDGYTIGVGNMGTQSAAPALLSEPQIRPGEELCAGGHRQPRRESIVARRNPGEDPERVHRLSQG
jgi:tripartite-type tricarboxylate transporter receptor subunit TctC